VAVISYFFQASLIVKCVLLILLLASLLSWTIIIQRVSYLRSVRGAIQRFTHRVWQDVAYQALYDELVNTHTQPEGIASVFMAGMEEFQASSQLRNATESFVMQNVVRRMQLVLRQEAMRWERTLASLATIGSVSPYIGLFGTVWGIMMAFHGLSNAEQVTIAMVAPGIAEALVATAAGLFAAIPAVIAYNRLTHQIDELLQEGELFQEQFHLSLSRLLREGNSSP